jgi:hypothetical protein
VSRLIANPQIQTQMMSKSIAKKQAVGANPFDVCEVSSHELKKR